MSRDLNLSQLTTELTDFLGLTSDLDLPPLFSVAARRTAVSGWEVRAFLSAPTDAGTYAAMRTWAAYTGGVVEVSEKPYPASHQASGMQRTLRLAVVVAEVPIDLQAGVDAMFEIPADEAVTV